LVTPIGAKRLPQQELDTRLGDAAFPVRKCSFVSFDGVGLWIIGQWVRCDFFRQVLMALRQTR
jgi:hypothetical protein